MINIKRTGGDPLGISQYQLLLNDQVLAESFDHNRPDDLPTLLRKAADAVTVARMNHGEEVYQVKRPSKSDAVITAEDAIHQIMQGMKDRKDMRLDGTVEFDPHEELQQILIDMQQFLIKLSGKKYDPQHSIYQSDS